MDISCLVILIIPHRRSLRKGAGALRRRRSYTESRQTRKGRERGNALVEEIKTLDRLAMGQRAEIIRLDAQGEFRARLIALGFMPGNGIQVVLESPWGDPVAYEVCGAVIALRRADARKITVKSVE